MRCNGEVKRSDGLTLIDPCLNDTYSELGLLPSLDLIIDQQGDLVDLREASHLPLLVQAALAIAAAHG